MADRRYRKIGIALLAAAVLLCGCKSGIPIAADVKEIKTYSLPETMIVVATERNRYQGIYTERVWNIELDEEGTTFQSYLLNQVREFLEDMQTMNLLADQEGVSLDGAETDQIQKLSKEYYDQLTKDDIAYMGIKQDDVITMYTEYYVANKLVYELTKDADLEISDSEAKVITIECIELADENLANEAYGKLAAGGDFDETAMEYMEGPANSRQLGRGEETGALEDVAFGLPTGQISGVFWHEDQYYIVRCVSDYNEEATQERKSRLYQERKRAAFNLKYEKFKEENPMIFSDDVWKKIKFSDNDKTTTKNFFELYYKYFPE